MSHYTHLTTEERELIFLYLYIGYAIRKMALLLNRSPSTISREIKRNTAIRKYRPSRAQERYRKARQRCGRRTILKDELACVTVRRLIMEKRWSPEQISKRLKKEGHAIQVSTPTLYRAIGKGLLHRPEDGRPGRKGFKIHLRHKGKRRVKSGTERRGKFCISNELADRPAEAQQRSRIGDWEADTMHGKEGTGCLVTIVDRGSRMTLCSKVAGPRKAEVAEAMIQLLSPLPKDFVQSLTPDRGKEFADHHKVTEALDGVQFYFPPPYQPWQRGTVENTNGLFREVFPRGYDFTDLSDDVIQDFCNKLNLRPRKCLNWKTPYEVMTGKVLHLI